MRVIISGGGIGGLATALALHHVGITDIQILESVKELKPLGVGINILPHAVRELTALGLGEDLDKIGLRTADLSYISEHGSLIWSEPRGIDAGYTWPQISVHRGKFQMMLAEKVRERLGEQALLTNARVITERTEGDQVVVTTETSEYRGDLLIVAEGIKSNIRAQWHPEEGAPIWNGAVLWRATTRAKPFMTERSMIMAGHRSLKFVAYPLGPVGPDGLQEINWIAEQVDPAMSDLQNDWNRVVPISRFAHLFDEWEWEWLNVPELIRTADEVLEYPMVDREPLDSWVRGRTVLLGDTAHPTYPVGSNGTSQALLDARTLAYALAAFSLEHALEFYQEQRLPATAALQNANRKMGPELVLQMVHERAPQGYSDIHDVIPEVELEQIAENYKKVAGFDRDTLNSQPSWDDLLVKGQNDND